MQQADHVMLVGGFPEHLHDQHIMVHGQVLAFKNGRDLKLAGSDFIVARFGRDAEFPEGFVHVHHEFQHAVLDGAEVVVFHLLVLGGHIAEEGASAHHQVRAQGIKLLVHQEVFLFRPQVGADMNVVRTAKAGQQPLGLPGDGSHGSQERRLFVQRLSLVRAESGWDAKRGAVFRPFDEGGAGGVPCGVAACFKGGAETAGREAGGVRLALHQALAGKFEFQISLRIHVHKGVVLFRRAPIERLEPVRVVAGSLFQSPRHHGLSHFIGDVGVQFFVLADGSQQFFVNGAGQVIAHGLHVEDILTVNFRNKGCGVANIGRWVCMHLDRERAKRLGTYQTLKETFWQAESCPISAGKGLLPPPSVFGKKRKRFSGFYGSPAAMEKLGKEGDAVKEGMGRDCREEGRTGVGEVPGFLFHETARVPADRYFPVSCKKFISFSVVISTTILL